MDVLEFLSRSEWPIVVSVTVWFLRQPLRQMVERVNPTKIDAWGLKAEFEKRLDKVDLLSPPTDPTDTLPGLLDSKKASIAIEGVRPSATMNAPGEVNEEDEFAGGVTTKSPEVIIIAAWARLERYIKMIQDELHPGRPIELLSTFKTDLTSLRQLGLKDDEISALHELRLLRNEVARNSIRDMNKLVTLEDAYRFSEATKRLRLRIHEERATKSKVASSSK